MKGIYLLTDVPSCDKFSFTISESVDCQVPFRECEYAGYHILARGRVCLLGHWNHWNGTEGWLGYWVYLAIGSMGIYVG